MNRKEIIKQLQSKTGNSNVSLPAWIDFEIHEGVLLVGISLEGIFKNMQEDDSAFEGWAICLKAWMPELIKRVQISWNALVPEGEQKLHYNRFKYRVWKFVQNYEWTITNSDSFDNYDISNCVMNFPKKEAQEKAENIESTMERDYVSAHCSEYDVINHQLPVGVFDKKVSALNRVFPGGNSQIDIWAMKDDVLHIFELKDKNNKKVGIISELMFYVNIMDDLMTHYINYPEDAKKIKLRGFDKLYDAYINKKINKIKGHFLAEELHPLISDNVVELINNNKLSHIEYLTRKL
ncbi:hypothetical protein EZS27_019589 [termite gut metagenome]|uniref:Uncharacterized protein n=1 Tax=termite gut metagenome TaxID=433724 RepID=A0A5J4REB4_9ZZZZ